MNDLSARVLLVDDEWTIRQQLSRALTMAGIRCECALDGDDALDRYVHGRHELVVTDLRMPERHGHSLAVTLLEQPDPPKVIALTGVTEPRLAKDLLARGVADIVFKPVNYFDLADRLKGMLVPLPTPSDLTKVESTDDRAEDAPATSAQRENPSLRLRQELEQLFLESPLPHRWLLMTLHWIDWKRLPNPPKELPGVLRQLSRSNRQKGARRSEGRVTMNRRAVALQMTNDFEPVGHPFKLAIRDVSRHGIGLLHSEPLSSQLIVVSWKGLNKDWIAVVARVLRCRQVGDFYDVGATIEQFQSAEI